MKKAIRLDESEFEGERISFLRREIQKAAPFLVIPIIGPTLYEIAKEFGYLTLPPDNQI